LGRKEKDDGGRKKTQNHLTLNPFAETHLHPESSGRKADYKDVKDAKKCFCHKWEKRGLDL
jgi:hypothetical protein